MSENNYAVEIWGKLETNLNIKAPIPYKYENVFMSIFSSDLLLLSANLTFKLLITDSCGVCFFTCTHGFRHYFIQNRLFKQRKQINGDMYIMYNSHVLGNFIKINHVK